jgi:replicative DNA helicase
MMQDVVRWAKSIKEYPGITWGIPSIDEQVIPMRPGNLECVIARPGHCKTSLLVWRARQEAKRILAQGKQDEEAVIFVTWEQSAEELTAMLMADPSVNFSEIMWGRADIDAIIAKTFEGVRMPIFIIGHGISGRNSDIPRMTPDLVMSAIERLQEMWGRRPTLVLMDYLQLIPTDTYTDRVAQVTEMPIKLKELALRIPVPIFAAVQAARKVDNYALPLPQMNDAQWASSIEQTMDKVYGSLVPAKTMDVGEPIEIGGKMYEVAENMVVLKLLKQRGDSAGHYWVLYFDPALMRLAELETEVVDFTEPVW